MPKRGPDFERIFNAGIANNGGPDVIPVELNLPNTNQDFVLEAWLSNFGSSNAHILRGGPETTLAGAQSLLERGANDLLMTVTGSGSTKRYLPEDVSTLLVLFEAQNTSGQFEIVTLRVTAYE